MKKWFASLEIRERRLISAAAGILLLLSLYVLVLGPMISEYRRVQNSVAEKEVQVAEMQQLALEVKQSRALAPKRAGIAEGRSLLGTIDSTAKANQLGESLSRVQPDGDNKANISLDNAPFDKVVRWLENLQRQQGIVIISGSVEKQTEPGLVSVRLELQGE